MKPFLYKIEILNVKEEFPGLKPELLVNISFINIPLNCNIKVNKFKGFLLILESLIIE